MTSLVLFKQNGFTITRGSYSHGGKHRFMAMAHSDSDMNIDEAVSDIRLYQFEPFLGTASVEVTNTSLIVSDLTRSGLELTIYYT